MSRLARHQRVPREEILPEEVGSDEQRQVPAVEVYVEVEVEVVVPLHRWPRRAAATSAVPAAKGMEQAGLPPLPAHGAAQRRRPLRGSTAPARARGPLAKSTPPSSHDAHSRSLYSIYRMSQTTSRDEVAKPDGQEVGLALMGVGNCTMVAGSS